MRLACKHGIEGNTIVVTLITLAIVAVFVDLSLQYTNSIAHNVQRSILLRQATNIGDSSTEMAFAAWRGICRAKQTTTLPGSSFDNELPTPSPGNFPGVSAYYLTNYTVNPLDSYWNVLTANNATPAPIAGPNHGDLSYYYLSTADVIIPTLTSTTASKLNTPAALTDSGNIIARVRRIFQKQTISLWRYAVFYNDDMEIHPGATMVINGDVHTNGRLFTGHNLLTLAGKTTYVDDWSIGFMNAASIDPNWAPDDPRRQEYETSHDSETPSSPHWSTGLPPASDQTQEPYGVAMSDYHSLIDYDAPGPPPPPPPPNSTPTPTLDPYTFQDQAGYVITIDANNKVKVYNSAGKDITSQPGNSNDAKAARAIQGALTPNQTIVDNREGATTGNANIRVATLDVGAIEAAMDSSDNHTNFSISQTVGTGKAAQTVNNVLYIVDTSAGTTGTTNKRGIRLTDGGKLPQGGLTIASGNPVYVQGDYNTGSVPSSIPGATPIVQPPSNTGNSASPTVAGYTRQPAAIVGDAVTVLSNSWVDSKGGTMAASSNTTVNAAFISGIVQDHNGYYSGGVENFPRFLENWGSKTFTYYGSMIELYQSEQAIGHWGAANVYGAPNRAWYFDTNFIATPPPGILASFNYVRSRWYMQ